MNRQIKRERGMQGEHDKWIVEEREIDRQRQTDTLLYTASGI